MSRPSPTGNVRSGSPRRRARSEAHGRPGTRGTPAGVVRAPVDRRPRAGTTTWSRRRAGPLASVACPRGRGAAISRGTGSFAVPSIYTCRVPRRHAPNHPIVHDRRPSRVQSHDPFWITGYQVVSSHHGESPVVSERWLCPRMDRRWSGLDQALRNYAIPLGRLGRVVTGYRAVRSSHTARVSRTALASRPGKCPEGSGCPWRPGSDAPGVSGTPGPRWRGWPPEANSLYIHYGPQAVDRGLARVRADSPLQPVVGDHRQERHPKRRRHRPPPPATNPGPDPLGLVPAVEVQVRRHQDGTSLLEGSPSDGLRVGSCCRLSVRLGERGDLPAEQGLGGSPLDQLD